MGAVFAIGGVVLALQAFDAQQDFESLRNWGRRVPGEVIAAREEVRSSRRSSTTYYHLTVQFRHGGGVIVKEIEVPEEPFKRFRAVNATRPAPCTVLVDPNRPDHFTIDEAVGEQISGRGTTFWMMLTLGLAIGGLCVFSGINTYKKALAIEHANRSAFVTGPWPPPGYGTTAPHHAPPYRPISQRGQSTPYRPS